MSTIDYRALAADLARQAGREAIAKSAPPEVPIAARSVESKAASVPDSIETAKPSHAASDYPWFTQPQPDDGPDLEPTTGEAVCQDCGADFVYRIGHESEHVCPGCEAERGAKEDWSINYEE